MVKNRILMQKKNNFDAKLRNMWTASDSSKRFVESEWRKKQKLVSLPIRSIAFLTFQWNCNKNISFFIYDFEFSMKKKSHAFHLRNENYINLWNFRWHLKKNHFLRNSKYRIYRHGFWSVCHFLQSLNLNFAKLNILLNCKT